MAAIDFPNSPTTNDIFTAAGKSWIWTGSYWSARISQTIDGGTA